MQGGVKALALSVRSSAKSLSTVRASFDDDVYASIGLVINAAPSSLVLCRMPYRVGLEDCCIMDSRPDGVQECDRFDG